MPDSGVTKTYLRLSRQELYDLVWSKPMTKIAKDFGVSDRAVAKSCARRQVPVPPRGWWERKYAGQNVKQAPLPEYSPIPVDIKNGRKTSSGPRKNEGPTKGKTQFDKFVMERNKTAREKLKKYRQLFSNVATYILHIDGWNCSYSFGLSKRYDPLRKKDTFSCMYDDVYDEHLTINLYGTFVQPARLNGQNVRFSIFQSNRLNKNDRTNPDIFKDELPDSVGTIQKDKNGAFWGYVFIPENMLENLLSVLSAKKINFLKLVADNLRYRQANVFAYLLQEEINDTD